MKFSVVITLAIVSSALSTDVSEINRVAECVKKAMNGGLPSINLPNFNPLEPENKTIHFDNKYIKGFINFTGFEVDGLADFKLEKVVPVAADDAVVFNYTINWPTVKIVGHYGQHLSIFSLPPITERVLVNITWIELRASGTWNMKTGSDQSLEYFYFDPTVKEVIDNSEVIPNLYLPLLKTWIEEEVLFLTETFTESPLAEELSLILKYELNERWIVGGQDRIRGLLENCKQ